MNNSCYGKTLESKRSGVNMRLVCSENKGRERTISHLFCAFKLFDENLTTITSKKRNILWNKPTIVGATILDFAIAKCHM